MKTPTKPVKKKRAAVKSATKKPQTRTYTPAALKSQCCQYFKRLADGKVADKFGDASEPYHGQEALDTYKAFENDEQLQFAKAFAFVKHFAEKIKGS